jgi:hypothetical protein
VAAADVLKRNKEIDRRRCGSSKKAGEKKDLFLVHFL